MKLITALITHLTFLSIIVGCSLLTFGVDSPFVVWFVFVIIPVTYILLSYLYARWSGDE